MEVEMNCLTNHSTVRQSTKMNNKYLYLPVMLFFMFSSTSKAEESNDFTFSPCDSNKYLNCLNKSKAACSHSATEARKACYDNVDLYGSDGNINDSFIKEASSCFSDRFQKNLGITTSEIHKCDSILSDSMKPYIEAAKKRKELSEKRFFEEDDQ